MSPFHNLNAEEHVVLQNKTFNYTELLVLYVVFSHPSQCKRIWYLMLVAVAKLVVLPYMTAKKDVILYKIYVKNYCFYTLFIHIAPIPPYDPRSMENQVGTDGQPKEIPSL